MRVWTEEELRESQQIAQILANRSADERDYLRMRTWREDRAIPFKPMDSAMADLLPWYAGGMGDE